MVDPHAPRARSEPDDVLAEAEAVYQDALKAMSDARDALQAGEFDEDTLREVAARYRAAALILFAERKRVAEARRSEGGVGDGAVDLDEARREIRGRLDRLRAAANTGDVSRDP